jgi:hypothetical protein
MIAAIGAFLVTAAKWFGGVLGAFLQWAFNNPAAALCLVLAAAALYYRHEDEKHQADAAATLVVMTADRDHERTRADQNAKNEKTAVDANGTLQIENKALKDANDAATRISTAAKAASDAAAARLKAARAALARAEARETELRKSIYDHDPACAAWGDLPVCPAIADRLRQRAAETGPP